MSGGTYEQPRLLGYSGNAETASDGPAMRESTRKREAYFLDYAQTIREVCDCPLMPLKKINVLGGQSWYYQQIFRLADDEEADPDLGILKAAGAYVKDELSQARQVKKSLRQRGG
ncbi:hypothetical protein [Marinobacter sp.]|uniref:hypothetical protein n=1 Tax=Marinobacter sp. TaxID=50741 RepID=UPI003A9374B3